MNKGLIAIAVAVVIVIGLPVVLKYVGNSGAPTLEDDKRNLSLISSSVANYRAAVGRNPASLQDLVPDYLIEIPRTHDDKDFIYSAQNGGVSISAMPAQRVADTTKRPATPRAGVGGFAEAMTGLSIQNELK